MVVDVHRLSQAESLKNDHQMLRFAKLAVEGSWACDSWFKFIIPRHP